MNGNNNSVIVARLDGFEESDGKQAKVISA